MQKPQYLILDGNLVDWNTAFVHLWSEAPKRGMNVFDSIRGVYSRRQASYRLIELNGHLQRLLFSAAAMGFPKIVNLEQLRLGIAKLVGVLDYQSDVYIRPTIYIEEGAYEFDTKLMKAHWYIVAFPLRKEFGETKSISGVISPWRKISNQAFPSTIKCGASYSLTRLSKIFAQQSGADDAVLLNERNFICETPGASIIVVKNEIAKSPPLEDGVLDGVTRRHLLSLLRSQFSCSAEFSSISIQDFLDADEVFICGTLDGVLQMTKCDGKIIGNNTPKIGKELAKAYEKSITGIEHHQEQWVTVFDSSAGRFIDS